MFYIIQITLCCMAYVYMYIELQFTVYQGFLFFQKRVYKLLGEINYAKERHRRLTEEKQAEKPFPLKPKS